jgi:NHL repeat/WD40-like Beta Propeller Repeat
MSGRRESFLVRHAGSVGMSVRRPILVMLCAVVGMLVFGGVPALAASNGVVGFFGGTGTAGGLFSTPGGVAVNDTSGNVYVVDSGNNRVQELGSGGAFVRAWGAGVVTPGAAGAGALADSSTKVTSVVTTSGAFVVGQTITGAGIPAGTTITAVAKGEITLSQPTTATAAGSDVALTVVAGAGNVPVNEQQTVTLGANTTGGTFTLTFTTPNPSSTTATTAMVAYNAPATGAGSVQEALEGLVNIGPGDVVVSGPAGGPWTIEFTGTRFADTNVEQMTAKATGLTVKSGAKTAILATLREGASAFEVCSEAVSCAKGVESAVAGGMSAPQGVAVEQVTGDVYVTDQGDHRVDEFTEAGAFVRAFGLNVGGTGVGVCTSTCAVGAAGAAAGELGASVGYPAVDPSTGDVYVADSANMRVDVFEADGVFKHAFGWGVANGANEFQVCTSVCQAGVASAGETNAGRFAVGSPTGVVVDGSGDVYVVDGGSPDFRVQKFGPVSAGNAPLAEFFASAYLTGSTSATAPSDVAVQPALGDVLVAREPTSPAEHLVYELGSGGGFLGAYAEGAGLPASSGLAVGPSAASVYFSTATGSRVFVLGTIAPPTVTVEAASGPTASEATLRGTVDPNETPPNGLETTWQFEYSTNQSEWSKAPAGKLAALTSAVAVAQTVTGLEGGTLYYVRLRAEKEYAAGSATSATVQLTTSAAAPSVSGESVSKVTATSAVFSAQINPEHLTTTYHFEYDTVPYTTSAGHGTSVPVPGDVIGDGSSDMAVSNEPQGLRPDTTYHYRLVAANATAITDGPEQIFTTQVQGGNLTLPDDRGYEKVSPSIKYGSTIFPISIENGTIQASEDGGAIAYSAFTPIVAEPPGNQLNNTEVLSVRGPHGWSSVDMAPSNETVIGEALGHTDSYKDFSSDLSLGFVQPQGSTPLSPEASVTERTVYLRSNATCETTPERCYLPLVTAVNTPPDTKFGGHEPGINGKGGSIEGIMFQGATPDLSHIVLYSALAALTPPPPIAGAGLYEWTAGRLQLVNVLPDGQASSTSSLHATTLGSSRVSNNVRHAISNDGSRIVWSAENHLYMRDMESKETIQLDANQGALETGAGEPIFQTANADGSKVFFTDGERLTADSTATSNVPDLYECEIVIEPSGLTCNLTDLTPGAHPGEHAGVQGLIAGASEDGSYVYFVASGVLASGATSDNLYNLYVRHEGTTTFIASLSGEDIDDFSENLSSLTTRVSPNGQYLAFMSDRELTGYNNHDANSGEADEEVYLYNAGARRLICASCDPSGARPVGFLSSDSLVDQLQAWRNRWLAGSIPGWTPYENGGGAVYQSRYLSDSGRLFFNSADALVPQDVNGKEDVYEYEPPGVGDCTGSSATYSTISQGCVGLISSGTSTEEAVFLDASTSGDDVFFLTNAKLSTQDDDTAYDVYDAHVCSPASPCVTHPATVPPPCDTAESCKPGPTPQPQVFGPSGSATFSGPGDLAPAPTASVKTKAKPLTRAQKLTRALRACERKPKKKRPTCRAQARKKYGFKTKAKRSETEKTSRRDK